MRIRILCLGILALLSAVPSARAQKRDAVDLLPAHTLACVELRNPSRLSREAAALLKNSSLMEIPLRLAKQRSGQEFNGGFRNYRVREMLGMMSMFLSPEMFAEVSRLRGGVVALTGFAEDGTPQGVGIIQIGESVFPGLYMRAFLTLAEPHLVGEVDGVALFRNVSHVYTANPGGAAKFEKRENGPVMALMPGLLLFGSSVDSLKDTIARAKGKSADVSLKSVRAFKNAAALRARPGLFVYVDAAALQAQLDEQARRPGSPLGYAKVMLKTFLGKQSVHSLTASLTLFNGSLEGQVRVQLNNETDSPLLGLLPNTAVRRELLHFAPKDARLMLAGGFGDGEKRWQTLVKLLDALDRFGGHGEANRPSKKIAELEEGLNLHIGKDVAAQLTGGGLIVHGNWVRNGECWTLLLRAADAAAADKLEKHGLPRLLSLGDAKIIRAVEEEVKGQRIKTVCGAKVMPSPLHYGRRGLVFVIGRNRDNVVAALAAGGRKVGWLSEAKNADTIKEIDEGAVLIGVVTPAQAVGDVFTQSMPPAKKVVAVKKNGKVVQPPLQPKAKEKEKESDNDAKFKEKLRQALEPLPPMTLAMNRKPDGLMLEMRWSNLRRAVPKLLDVWIDSLIVDMSRPAAMPVPPVGVAAPAAAKPAAKPPAKKAPIKKPPVKKPPVKR